MPSEENSSVPVASSHSDRGQLGHSGRKRSAPNSESAILDEQGKHHYERPEIVINPVEDAKTDLAAHGKQPEILLRSLGPTARNVRDFDEGSVATTTIPRRNSEILGFITYKLYVSFLRFNPPGEAIDIFTPMVAPGEFGEIEGEAARFIRRHLEENCAHELYEKDLLFRNGTATFDSSEGKKTRELLSPFDWDIIRADIASHCYPRTLRMSRDVNDLDIHVDIRCEFITLRNRREANRTFAQTKSTEIYKLRRKAFNGQEYYRRRDLEMIACRETIRKIVEEDKPPGMGVADTDQLVSAIFKNARILFAMCVDARLRMLCLKALMHNGIDDRKFPVEEADICHPECGHDFDDLLKRQASFRAAEFNHLGEHQDFDQKVVIPMHYCPTSEGEESLLQEDRPSDGWVRDARNSGTDPSDKYRSRCGWGSVSEVFRVKIDEDHHKLSEDKTAAFAVKEFSDQPRRRGKDFARELKVLQRLRGHSHPHMVTHLATWTQNDKYYMLFPFATCNLRTYMTRWTFGRPLRQPTLWLLEQLRELADALRIIHNLPGDGELGSLAQLAVPSKESGWHHDLKPENILFFSTQTTPPPARLAGEGTICIADFGSGKVHTYRTASVNTKSPNGTPDYEAPDLKTEGSTSRPYDIWSLGCVFLEMLVWALLGGEAVKDFANDRHGRRNPKHAREVSEDSAFWQVTEDNRMELRQNVRTMFRKLHDTIEHGHLVPFGKVLQLVKRMLTIDRKARVDAVHVWNALDTIHREADINFMGLGEEGMETLAPQLSLDATITRIPSPQRLDTTAYFTTSPSTLFSPLRTNSRNSSRSDMS
ncbi:MAG: hypothetical protein Q9208_005721 [Pyrenodesmia sp. 3 TL-2023]